MAELDEQLVMPARNPDNSQDLTEEARVIVKLSTMPVRVLATHREFVANQRALMLVLRDCMHLKERAFVIYWMFFFAKKNAAMLTSADKRYFRKLSREVRRFAQVEEFAPLFVDAPATGVNQV